MPIVKIEIHDAAVRTICSDKGLDREEALRLIPRLKEVLKSVGFEDFMITLLETYK